MKPVISVIICTHNPRADYLERVIEALKSQTLPMEKWEVLLIDNASDQQLSSKVDLSWHPNARHVREEQLGLTSARLRGIQEAEAETLIFVDDDNVLNSDYLEAALKISEAWSMLGAWSGQIRPDFEEQPPEWTKPYWYMIAIREFGRDQWSNLIHEDTTTPCGAGLCVRRVVAEKYAELVRDQSERATMDRKGKLLTSCGDSDIAFTACDIGLGKGVFVSLKLTHLIPAYRIQEDYLLKLAEGIAYSKAILNSFRGEFPHKLSWQARLLKYYRQHWKVAPIISRLYEAEERGLALAIKELNNRRTGKH